LIFPLDFHTREHISVSFQVKALKQVKTLKGFSKSIMNSQKFIGCYVTKVLLKRIENFMEEYGFSTKSELIRSAIRKTVNDGDAT